ncbi:hypothetical protein K439DRAFT_1633324 [Ramaria rubella]|nr:hypothetical protein K439DRAFT_1633324 [Ramaria rubella]
MSKHRSKFQTTATSSAILYVAMAQDERNGSVADEEHGAYCTSEELVSRNEVSTPMKLQLKKCY